MHFAVDRGPARSMAREVGRASERHPGAHTRSVSAASPVCGATRAQRKSPERLRVRGPLGKQRSAGLPASAAATAAAAWAAPAALAFLCFVHAQRTSPHLLAVQRLDGALRVGARHLNETEAARPAGLAIV